MQRKLLIPDPPRGLRERTRADGSTRIWWEPSAAARELGFTATELSEDRLSWSRRQAEKMNDDVARVRERGGRAAPARGGRTMGALIKDYRSTRHFTTKADATRAGYDQAMNIIDAKWGAHTAISFTPNIIDTWYETNLEHRGANQAGKLNVMMSILMRHAERRGWRPKGSNPCGGLEKVPANRRKRVVSWPEQDALVASADAMGMPSIALAILLMAYQGQRVSDVLGATPGDMRLVTLHDPATGAPRKVWIWALVRSKRQTEGGMPIHPDILDRLRRHIAQRPADADTLLVDDATGKPLSMGRAAKLFARARAAAARETPSVADVTLRDFRRTFGNRSRRGGATKSDTSDVLGNSAATNFTLAEIYMSPQFETASRAVMAVQRPKPKKEDLG